MFRGHLRIDQELPEANQVKPDLDLLRELQLSTIMDNLQLKVREDQGHPKTMDGRLVRDHEDRHREAITNRSLLSKVTMTHVDSLPVLHMVEHPDRMDMAILVMIAKIILAHRQEA